MDRPKKKTKKPNRYQQILERIFLTRYRTGAREVPFVREDIDIAAEELVLKRLKNLGDLPYTYRYRAAMPESIRNTAPAGEAWIIRGTGKARYMFALVIDFQITPNMALAQTKVPDSTPGVVAMYALSDEQAVLAKIRYNRLVDIFTGVACYSLQNHLKTTVPSMGAVETDELYIGVDKRGAHYVFPVQAKGGKDMHSVVQIEQDFALCRDKFPQLICRAIGAQFIEENLIALFEFQETESGVRLTAERHYCLVPPEQITGKDLLTYSNL